MRTEDSLQLLQEPIRQLKASGRREQLTNRLLGLPAHVPGAAQEHGHQSPVVLPARTGTDRPGFRGLGGGAPQPALLRPSSPFLRLLPGSPPLAQGERCPRGKGGEPHILDFAAGESVRVVKEKSLSQMQHGAQG